MSTSFLPQIKCTLCFLISLLIVSNAQLTYIDQFCDPRYGNYTVLSDYEDNVKSAITTLTSDATTSYSSTHTTGIGEDRVNASYLCRNDVSLEVCQSCVASTVNITLQCLFRVESIIFYEECIVHYSNRPIFSEMEDLPRRYDYSTNSADREVHFSEFLGTHVTDLITETTSSSSLFATSASKYSSSESAYALAQCNPDIASLDCKTCLENCFDGFAANYSSRVYGQIFSPSCRLSYILTSVELSRPWKFAQTFDEQHGAPSFSPVQNSAPIPTFTPDQSGGLTPNFTPEKGDGPSFSPGRFSASSGGTRRDTMMGATIAAITIVTSLKLFL